MKYQLHLFSTVDILVPPPAIMIGGLLFAMILNLYPLIHQLDSKSDISNTAYRVIKAKPWNVTIFFVGTLFLILLLGYVIVENYAEMGSLIIVQ